MTIENAGNSLHEEYIELSRNSLIRVQYSCCGNSTSIEDSNDIPIVPDEVVRVSQLTYTMAREEDVESILKLLKTSKLPTNDLSEGHRMFFVALSGNEVAGCAAVEPHENSGLLRSLAIKPEFRENGAGGKLLQEAEKWANENGIKTLYLLTTTAAGFFEKSGWETIERASAPSEIAGTTEFASVCPTTATCMKKEL